MRKGFIFHIYSHLNEEKLFYSFFSLSNLLFSIWLFSFWPAIITRDSINSWDQITTNAYSNWHPYIFTFYLKILSMLSFTPAAVAIFQILLSSFLSAFTFSRLYRRKNHLLVIISFTLFTLSIPIGLYNITIWKDIIFSQLIIFWGILAYFSIKDTRHDLSYSVLFLLSLLLFFTASVRYNGIVFLLFIPLVFFVGKITNLKKTSVFLLISVVLYISSHLMLPTIFSITDNKKLLNLSYKIQLDAAILKNGGFSYDLNQAHYPLSNLNRLISIREMTDNYSCQNTNAILFNQNIHPDQLEDNQYYLEVNAISNHLILNNIHQAFIDRACIFMSVLLSEGTLYYNTLDEENTSENDSLAHLKQDSKSLPLYRSLRSIIDISRHPPFNLLFWNVWLPLLAFFFSLFWGYFKDKALFAYSSIITIQLPFLFFTITANEFRYVYFLYLGSFFLIPMLTRNTPIKSK